MKNFLLFLAPISWIWISFLALNLYERLELAQAYPLTLHDAVGLSVACFIVRGVSPADLKALEKIDEVEALANLFLAPLLFWMMGVLALWAVGLTV